MTDDSFLILFNGHHKPLDFLLPDASYGDSWRIAVDTTSATDEADETEMKAGSSVRREARSTLVLIRTPQTQGPPLSSAWAWMIVPS